jgi:hypothetical protein
VNWVDEGYGQMAAAATAYTKTLELLEYIMQQNPKSCTYMLDTGC